MSNNTGIVVYNKKDLDSRLAAFLIWRYGGIYNEEGYGGDSKMNDYDQNDKWSAKPYQFVESGDLTDIINYKQIISVLSGQNSIFSTNELVFVGMGSDLNYYEMIKYYNRNQRVVIFSKRKIEINTLLYRLADEYVSKHNLLVYKLKTMFKNSISKSKTSVCSLIHEKMMNDSFYRDKIIRSLGYRIEFHICGLLYTQVCDRLDNKVRMMHKVILPWLSSLTYGELSEAIKIDPNNSMILYDTARIDFKCYLNTINKNFFNLLNNINTVNDLKVPLAIGMFVNANISHR